MTVALAYFFEGDVDDANAPARDQDNDHDGKKAGTALNAPLPKFKNNLTQN
jgi:hypothetical protein